jgi:hypothetical protein
MPASVLVFCRFRGDVHDRRAELRRTRTRLHLTGATREDNVVPMRRRSAKKVFSDYSIAELISLIAAGQSREVVAMSCAQKRLRDPPPPPEHLVARVVILSGRRSVAESVG